MLVVSHSGAEVGFAQTCLTGEIITGLEDTYLQPCVVEMKDNASMQCCFFKQVKSVGRILEAF